MFPDHLLHPDHIVPAVKFIAALIKFSHQAIAQMLVKIDAVIGEVLVLLIRTGDAGVDV